eukprot:6193292-Pleurochrysis_carterae.AAC.5
MLGQLLEGQQSLSRPLYVDSSLGQYAILASITFSHQHNHPWLLLSATLHSKPSGSLGKPFSLLASPRPVSNLPPLHLVNLNATGCLRHGCCEACRFAVWRRFRSWTPGGIRPSKSRFAACKQTTFVVAAPVVSVARQASIWGV